MLQFIAKDNDRYSIPEQAQMAIEGGCKWVHLDPGDMTDGQIREIAAEIMPLCKETSTILTMSDHVELARDLGIHGVLLTGAGMGFDEARELCGPEAIIGVMAATASAAAVLRNRDVDYIAMKADMPAVRVSENVEALRSVDFMLPVIAYGDYPVRLVPELMETGINGIALGAAIADAHDPVERTSEILNSLTPRPIG